MSYLSSKSIIHGDLAARNILIAKDGTALTAKVSDFGMARILEGSYYTIGQKPLPVKWTAPEVSKSKFLKQKVINYGKLSLKSDVWSFGICLWEIFSRGKVPYPGLSNEEVAKKVTSGYQMTVPECQPQVAKLMLDCWKVNPGERPSFSQLLEEFGKLVAPNVKRNNTFLLNFNSNYNLVVKE